MHRPVQQLKSFHATFPCVEVVRNSCNYRDLQRDRYGYSSQLEPKQDSLNSPPKFVVVMAPNFMPSDWPKEVRI